MEQMDIETYKKEYGQLGNCSIVTYSIMVNMEKDKRLLPIGLQLQLMLGRSGEVKLANGYVWHDKTKWHVHAWLEDDRFCYDFANGSDCIMFKSKYYRIGKVKDVIRYTRKEAMQKAAATGFAGFWDM